MRVVPLIVCLGGSLLVPQIVAAQQPVVQSLQRQILPVNDPFSPVITVAPSVDSGRAFVKVRNNSIEAINIKRLSVRLGTQMDHLPVDPFQVLPAETRQLEITSLVERLLAQEIKKDEKGNVEETLWLELALSPPGETEPGEFEFEISVTNGLVVSFHSAENESAPTAIH